LIANAVEFIEVFDEASATDITSEFATVLTVALPIQTGAPVTAIVVELATKVVFTVSAVLTASPCRTLKSCVAIVEFPFPQV
jgi:hypothetical protein